MGQWAGSLIVVLGFAGVVFALAALTGGLAGAIAAGGREERSLLANAVIGFLGWLLAGVVIAGLSGSWPEQLTIPWLALTLLFAIAICTWDDRRGRRRARAEASTSSPV
jgi:prepilin signal peptidase PulO-like enzyme (type II secretory pathway)